MDGGQGAARNDAAEPAARPPLRFQLGPTLRKLMTDHELDELCQLNRDWRIERTSEGEIIAMPPTRGKSGRLNFELTRIFGAWVAADGRGVAFVALRSSPS
jgi:Uma2 family endonuclease